MNILTSFQSVFIKPLSEFLYPPFCMLCRRRLRDDERRVCFECWSSFSTIKKDDPVYLDLKKKFTAAQVVDDCFSLFVFEKEGKLQEVIHLLKYSGFTSFGFRLGQEIGDRLAEEEGFRDVTMIAPVPLHRLKFRERGYNQSECICKGISNVTGIPVYPSLLKRVRFTSTQTKLNHEERDINVAGAFSVPVRYRNRLHNQKILLVDDVITTGSTIRECAREVRKFGALGVVIASVAHAY